LITAKELEAEKHLEAVMPEVRQKGYLDREVFLRLARWKSPRPRRFYESNTSAKVRASTGQAFQASSVAKAAGTLSLPPQKLAGVALRTATAILHWMRPNEFPILDVRIVRALGEPQPSSWENVDFYASIAEKCRAHSRRLRIDLRTLDRAMWAWDKQYSPSKRAH
jgi:hypothetical protein